MATKMVDITTTLHEDQTSTLLGQTTLCSSPTHSLKKRIILDTLTLLHTVTDQEGLEPPTLGFGDRRSTIRATDLNYFYTI